MPTELVSAGPTWPITGGVVYALPASPCIVESPGVLERSTLLAGPFTGWSAGYHAGGGFVKSASNTTIKSTKIKMTGLFSNGSYSGVAVKDSPSNYWALNETSGTVAKDLVGGKNGTISGGVVLNGESGMTFNGTTGQIITPAVTIPPVCTVEMWIKFTTIAPDKPTLSNRRSGGSSFFGVTSGLLFYYNGGGDASTPPAINNNQWHHAIYLLNNTSVTFYVNGVVNKNVIIPQVVSETIVLDIGSDNGAAWFPGSISNIAIYPKALTAQQIAAHYAAR